MGESCFDGERVTDAMLRAVVAGGSKFHFLFDLWTSPKVPRSQVLVVLGPGTQTTSARPESGPLAGQVAGCRRALEWALEARARGPSWSRFGDQSAEHTVGTEPYLSRIRSVCLDMPVLKYWSFSVLARNKRKARKRPTCGTSGWI